ncbi:hypothetical protein [Geothrix alkalitolerans]|uniref:hypothetical protein n=1 Tax=Geothrix alkalitolerans TaxID=2922724 RepID=UPI001FB0061C|nr:hypothetical protein [Geothrix alkalitolerans]
MALPDSLKNLLVIYLVVPISWSGFSAKPNSGSSTKSIIGKWISEKFTGSGKDDSINTIEFTFKSSGEFSVLAIYSTKEVEQKTGTYTLYNKWLCLTTKQDTNCFRIELIHGKLVINDEVNDLQVWLHRNPKPHS